MQGGLAVTLLSCARQVHCTGMLLTAYRAQLLKLISGPRHPSYGFCSSVVDAIKQAFLWTQCIELVRTWERTFPLFLSVHLLHVLIHTQARMSLAQTHTRTHAHMHSHMSTCTKARTRTLTKPACVYTHMQAPCAAALPAQESARLFTRGLQASMRTQALTRTHMHAHTCAGPMCCRTPCARRHLTF